MSTKEREEAWSVKSSELYALKGKGRWGEISELNGLRNLLVQPLTTALLYQQCLAILVHGLKDWYYQVHWRLRNENVMIPSICSVVLVSHLMVPEKRTGSCGITDTDDRRASRVKSFVSTPSRRMRPRCGDSRNSASISEDLPAPVRPTMPVGGKRAAKNLND